ncbi:MAG: actin-related protein 2/3 complex subunit 5 family protein [Bacteroidetes bacterium]|nr:actin-related protein 2/3 complex subunit 5 family protein [Bacteroidota bacterium]
MAVEDPLAQRYERAAPFFRDAKLEPKVAERYREGLILRDPTYCDASYHFGGFAAPFRYLIFSQHALNLDAFGEHPEWGLCVFPRGPVFKVLGHERRGGFEQVTLLHIDEADIEALSTPELTPWEQEWKAMGRQLFEAALVEPPLPQHTEAVWLDRMVYPLGVRDDGTYFEAWNEAHSAAPTRRTLSIEIDAGDPINFQKDDLLEVEDALEEGSEVGFVRTGEKTVALRVVANDPAYGGTRYRIEASPDDPRTLLFVPVER